MTTGNADDGPRVRMTDAHGKETITAEKGDHAYLSQRVHKTDHMTV